MKQLARGPAALLLAATLVAATLVTATLMVSGLLLAGTGHSQPEPGASRSTEAASAPQWDFAPRSAPAEARPATAPASQRRGPALQSLRRGLTWAILLGALGWLARRSNAPTADWRLPAGLALLALVLRLSLPAWAPLHANDHGIAELHELVAPGAQGAAISEYGQGWADFVGAARLPLGGGADFVLALGAGLGAAAVGLLFALGRAAGLAAPAAAVAAFALAVHPAHVRLSLSESPRPLAGALLLLGIAAGLRAVRSQGAVHHAAVLAAAAAWALALELRVTTAVLPLVGAAFVLVVAGLGPLRRPGWSVGLGVALVGLAAWGHAPILLDAFGDASARPPGPAWDNRLLSSHHSLLRYPLLTGAAVLPLAGLGVLNGRRHLRLVAACLGAVAVLLPLSLSVIACRTDVIRYQSTANLFVFLLVGVAVSGAWPVRKALVAATLLLATSAPGLIDIARPDVHEQAFALARTGGAARVLAAPATMPEAPRIRTHYPVYVARPGAADCAVWIGPSCWSFTEQEVAAEDWFDSDFGPMRGECVELLGGTTAAAAALPGLVAATVPHRDQEFHAIPAESPRVGYAPCPPAGVGGPASGPPTPASPALTPP